MAVIRTLLLLDVVDSTRITETLGDEAAAALWAAHDRVVRELLPVWNGREIDKTDGMLLLFESAAQAAGCALACQAALARLAPPLWARAGLHTGPVVLRENLPEDIARGAKPLEVDGLAKPVTARVMGLARGGQLLLTATAAQALQAEWGDAPPPAWQLVCHGWWMVKGVTRPLQVHELAAAGATLQAPDDTEKAWQVARWPARGPQPGQPEAPGSAAGTGTAALGPGDSAGEAAAEADDAEPAQWRPVREIPNNLPLQSTSFVGREREQREVREMLGRARLVTLLGMGGLGKTRLSLQVAQQLLPELPDGAWFVDLSALREPSLVAAEAARVLGLRDEVDRSPLQAVAAHLKSRRALLVLDNCEHLLEAAAELAHTLLRSAPGLRLLASSREALRVPGEQLCPVLPLPVPARGAAVAALRESPAVRLFVARAQAHKPAFTLDDEREAEAVAELVARLEGIPLALELAAARVKLLSVADINRRLSDRYKLLTGGARVLQPRQQTLRALVDWSYDLLQPAEQRLLQRLGVFAGGFDLEAAETVTAAEPPGGLDPLDVMDGLGVLVEKSLVIAEAQGVLNGDTTRYRMLETLREYALDKLSASGERAAVAAAHAQYFFDLAKQGRLGLQGPTLPQWLQRLEAEHDNLRLAMALAAAGGVDPVIAVKLAVALQSFWILRGHVNEGRALVAQALALPAVQAMPQAQAHALYVGAALAAAHSDHGQARQLLQQCLALRREMGRPVEVAATLSTLALARLQGGDVAGALADEREALALFEAAGDGIGVAIGHLHIGQMLLAAGDGSAAVSALQRALQTASQHGHREVQAEAEAGLGEAAFEAGDVAMAQAAWSRSLAVAREAGDRGGEARATHGLARVALHAGRLGEAGALLAQALPVCRQLELHEPLLRALEDAVRLAAARGQPALALAAAAAVDHQRQRQALHRLPAAQARWQALLETLHATPGDQAGAPRAHGEPLVLDELPALLLAAG